MSDYIADKIHNAIHKAFYLTLTDKGILRDFFAGCALKAMAEEYTAEFSAEEIGERVYKLADAMLAVREKSDESH